MDAAFLKERVGKVFDRVEDFAAAMSVSRKTVYNWFDGQIPHPSRILKIVDALKLDPQDVDALLGVPQTQVEFRRKGLKEAEPAIAAAAKSIAETFFKIEADAYRPTDGLLSGVSDKKIEHVVKYLRGVLSLADDEPATLNYVLAQLKKYSLEVYYLPFKRLGLSGAKTANREVAFTALHEDRAIVFLDAERKFDESTFDLCHELAELVIGFDQDPSDGKEQKCNEIARELIFPKRFIEANSNRFAIFTKAKGQDVAAAGHLLAQFWREFNWSPVGICLALQSVGLIAKDSPEAKLLFWHQKRMNARSILDLYFSRFDSKDFDSLKDFFDIDIQKSADLFRPFIKLRDAATYGSMTSRRLAEMLSIDSGDADELVRHWTDQLEAEEPSSLEDDVGR